MGIAALMSCGPRGQVQRPGDEDRGTVSTSSAALRSSAQTNGDPRPAATSTDGSNVGCSIEDIAPRASNTIESGTAAGQIPPDIAGVLANNCGCHYADETSPPQLHYPGQFHMETAADFHVDYDGMPFHKQVLARVATDGPLQMPPNHACTVEGGVSIDQADREILISWLEALAPDGAHWP